MQTMTDIYVSQDEEAPEFWRVEETNQDRVICAIVLFAGQDAEGRAREYAQWLETRVGSALAAREELVQTMAQPRKRSG
jgi:hypothetical protein